MSTGLFWLGTCTSPPQPSQCPEPLSTCSSSILEHGLAFQGTNNEGIPSPSVAFCLCSFVKKERINQSFLGWGIELV